MVLQTEVEQDISCSEKERYQRYANHHRNLSSFSGVQRSRSMGGVRG